MKQIFTLLIVLLALQHHMLAQRNCGTGRNVLQHNATCTSGSNTIILDMESLPNGYYLLVIDNGNASSTMRVVKN